MFVVMRVLLVSIVMLPVVVIMTPCFLLFSQEAQVAVSDQEHRGVENFKTYYTSEKRKTFFQCANLSSSGGEKEVIMEVCFKVEKGQYKQP